MSNTIARHCTAEDTEEYSVYEVDGEDLKTTLVEAAKFIEELDDAGKTYEVDFEASDPNDAFDFFQVVVFKVDK